MLNMVLKKMLHFLSLNQEFLATLYCALFSSAYFGMFRVGEITTGDHPVKVNDVQIGENKDKVLFILRTSKTHGKGDKLQKIKICRTDNIVNYSKVTNGVHNVGVENNNNKFCPFRILRCYMNMRPAFQSPGEPFFIFRDYQPVAPLQ